MGSPTKDRYKQGLQHQILTNYYLSKFDRYMSRLNDKKVQTTFPQRSILNKGRSNPKRKNFKHAILQRKGVRKSRDSNQQNRKKSEKKSFRQDLQHRHTEEKVKKQNRKNFHLLEDSIVNQLYKPSPSPLQNGNYQEIEIQHKIISTKNEQRIQKIEPFKLYQYQHYEQHNIQINQNYQSQIYNQQLDSQSYKVNIQKIQHQKITFAIKQTFQKRNPSRKRSPSNRNQSKQKIQSLRQSKNTFNNSIQQKQYTQQYNQSQISSQFVKDSKVNLEKNESSQIYPKFGSQLEESQNSSLIVESQRKSSVTGRQKDRKNSNVSGQRNYNSKNSRKSSFQKSNHNQQIKNQSFYNDSSSLNANIYETKQGQSQSRNNSSSFQDPNNSFRSRSSRYKHSSQNVDKDSFHEVSMASQISMTSDQAIFLKQSLQKQLNQNQFGPYQSVLINLVQLLEEYPKAYPIFMVSQRILQDRIQYQKKREAQHIQMSRYQVGIQNIRRETKKRKTEIEMNTINILKLIRQLSSLIS